MKKRVNISLDEDIAEQTKVLTKNSHRNVSQWITDAVCNSMEESKTKGKKGNKR
jgi:metal-responsive CopG/Arc/MetJ family transcriptional regulator